MGMRMSDEHNDLNTIEQMEQFLTVAGSRLLVASGKDDIIKAYSARRLKTATLRWINDQKARRALLIKITGYSRQQITRLVKQYHDTDKIERQQRTYQGFERLYAAKIFVCWTRLMSVITPLGGPTTKSFASVLISSLIKHNTNG